MRTRFVVLGLALANLLLVGCAESIAPPVLPDRVVGAPPGWTGSIGPSRFYEIGLYRLEHFSGHSAVYLDGQPNYTTETAVLQQAIKADNYRGKRIRFSAWVKTQDLQGPVAGLWMRIDGLGVSYGFDDMSKRPLSGNMKWHKISIVLDVPYEAVGIVIGALLQGGGPLYSGFMVLDEMKLEQVSFKVPTTNMLSAPAIPTIIPPANTIAKYLNAPLSPVNADFEQIP
jgi:hypothetical protein